MGRTTLHIPKGGLNINLTSPLFIADVESFDNVVEFERRLFLDLPAVIAFISGRKARLRALFTPAGASVEEVVVETVAEAFEFQPPNTFLLKFESDSTVLWLRSANADVQLETCDQIYPTSKA